MARYVGHHVVTHWRQRLLRQTYAERIANPLEQAHLRLPTVALPACTALPPGLASAAETLRAEAELVHEHRFDVLGSGLVDLGEEIDWSCDFKSGYRWPLAFYQDVVVTRLTDASDAKVPWELSRGHHLLTLARAAALFEDARFVDELERQLDSWLHANPTGYGINWTNPMEVALRAVNWVWAIATLEGRRPLEPSLRMRVTRSLQAHGRHIAANLEGTPYLRSNHYLSNLLGLLVLGAVLEGDPEAKEWFRFARHGFEREIQSQVHTDGVGFEASLPYHGLALEIFLVAKTITDDVAPLSATFDDRLRRMIGASRVLRHRSGRLPLFGDGDSGRVLPGSLQREPTLDHLLWLGAAVFASGRPIAGEPHPEVAWTLGVAAWQQLLEAPEADPATGSAFPAAGFYALRCERAQVFVHCGDVGQNGNGGHAHNDLLSFELSYREPLVVDAGTYAYTSDPAARNAFRSTVSHNTVAVGGAEINPIVENELFRLRQLARPRIDVWEEFDDHVRLVASHDGYRRLRPPVIHRRAFLLERASGRFEIRDELLGRGRHTAEAFLHLAPGTRLTRSGDHHFELDGRCETITLTFRGVTEVELAEGWVSERFGVRERAPVLIARVSGVLPMRFGCEFLLGHAP